LTGSTTSRATYGLEQVLNPVLRQPTRRDRAQEGTNPSRLIAAEPSDLGQLKTELAFVALTCASLLSGRRF